MRARMQLKKRLLEIEALEHRHLLAYVPAETFLPQLSTPQQFANFGHEVAISDDYRVVAANGVTGVHPSFGVYSGEVHVFDASNSLIKKLVVSSTTGPTYDFFARSIALSGDILVVGSYNDSQWSTPVHVFDLASASDQPIVTIMDPFAPIQARFGRTVATNGTHIAISSMFYGAGRVYVYDLNSPIPTDPIVTIDNPTLNGGAEFGHGLWMEGDLLAIGAPNEDTVSDQSGLLHVFDLASATPEVPLSTINPPLAEEDLNFGRHVHIEGDHVVVGVPRAEQVFVYDVKSATPAIPIHTLASANPAALLFGSSVAMSGQSLLVGASAGDILGGHAFVFDLGSATPKVPILEIENPTPGSDDYFGHSVAIEDNMMLVGARRDMIRGIPSGNVYVFDLDSATPDIPVDLLDNTTPAVGAAFGSAVAKQGNLLAVGTEHFDDSAIDEGRVEIFDLSSAAPTVPILLIPNPAPEEDDQFGATLALEGDILSVGSQSKPFVYLYDLGSATPTIPMLTLSNPTPNNTDAFGSALALEGNYVVAGAPEFDGVNANEGVAYVFDLESTTPDTPILTLHNPEPRSGDVFGASVAIDGESVIVGSPNSGSSGRSYVFDLGSASPQLPIANLYSPETTYDEFGSAVDINGSAVVVGASRGRKAYYFELDSPNPTIPALTFAHPSTGSAFNFGHTVSLFDEKLAIGAPGTPNVDGAVFIYDLRSSLPISPMQTIHKPAESGNLFGHSVAFDGGALVIGAPRDFTQNVRQGAAYFYVDGYYDFDFNQDDLLDCADIDALTTEIAAATNNAAFDLTGDGLVNQQDLESWLQQAGAVNLGSDRAYLLGDANLDGAVDGRDFFRWNEHKFTANSNWCDGDFNADGAVDGADFILWSDNKFASSDTVAVMVRLEATTTRIGTGNQNSQLLRDREMGGRNRIQDIGPPLRGFVPNGITPGVARRSLELTALHPGLS